MAIKIDCSEQPGGVVTFTVLPEPAREGPFEVDLLSSHVVETRLKEELEKGKKRFLIDLANVTYMHSRAFWAIVRAGEKLNEDAGKVVLVNLSPYLRQLLDLTSAAETLEVRPNVAAGLTALGHATKS